MKPRADSNLERFRLANHGYGVSPRGAMYGAFLVGMPTGVQLKVISSGEAYPENEWEHVSVSCYGEARCPTWDEMCFVKDLFWLPEEMVIQFHPPRSRYININEFVLHLWKPPYECRLPPREKV